MQSLLRLVREKVKYNKIRLQDISLLAFKNYFSIIENGRKECRIALSQVN